MERFHILTNIIILLFMNNKNKEKYMCFKMKRKFTQWNVNVISNY
jgi:hypothetical protein